MGMPPLPWAYLGPETTLPLTSVLAAVVGILLIFWRYVLGLGKRIFQTFFGKSTPASGGRGQGRESAVGKTNPDSQPPTPGS
jgi:hypothetical protein